MNRPTDQPKPVPLRRIRELFYLHPETGALLRKVARGRAKKDSDAVRMQWDERFGELRGVVWVDGQKFQAPRVILSLHQGKPVPVRLVVDHRDGQTWNNQPGNLRAVTRTANQLNRRDNRPPEKPPLPDGEVSPW